MRAEQAQQEQQAKQRSAAQLSSIAEEAGRLEAAARQEGEARCATIQVKIPSHLWVLSASRDAYLAL